MHPDIHSLIFKIKIQSCHTFGSPKETANKLHAYFDNCITMKLQPQILLLLALSLQILGLPIA